MLRHILVAFLSVSLLNTQAIAAFNPQPNPEPGGPTTGSGTR